ncbi:MAG: class I SAM-dependent methyltransferase [Alphaproteobacteria bacterium]|nr:class I SAM-dependent methyltransferase [Alphaproteobacteria bacterium]
MEIIFLLMAALSIIAYVICIVIIIDVIKMQLFKIAPTLPSRKVMRKAILAEIRKIRPDAKTVIDIGSGLGGMAMLIAREFPKSNVAGVEFKILPFCFSWIIRFFRGPKNCRFIFGDATRFIKDKKFDIAVCYSGPWLMHAIEPYRNNFNILLSLDFPLPNTKPAQTIMLHKDSLGQHRIYVYERKA